MTATRPGRMLATGALWLVVAFLPHSVEAQVDEAARATARELADAGGVLFQEERYAEAFAKLDRAYEIVKVPTLAFYSARCLEKMGRWVEASERYLEASRLPLPGRARELHERAREDAQAHRESLLPRIPRIRVVLRGADTDDARVLLDGEPVGTAVVDLPLFADPGEHVVAAVRGGRRVEETVHVEEGDTAEVELTVPEPPVEPAPQPEEAVEAPPASPDPAEPDRTLDAPSSPPEPTDADGDALRVASYAAFGIGGAAVAAGAITGGVLLSLDADLGTRCLDGLCSGAVAGDVRRYNALRPATTVLLSVGGVGLAAGAAAFFLAPSSDREAGWSPLLGPGFAGVRARF